MRNAPRLLSALVIAPGLAVSTEVASAQGYQWINPDGGQWEWAPNWSRPTYPSTLANNVYVAEPGAYTILASTPLAVRSLHIPNPDALVVFGPGSNLTLGTGPFPIDGTLEFRDLGTNTGSQSPLLLSGQTELTGSGELLVTNDVPQRLTRIGNGSGGLLIAEGFAVRGSFYFNVFVQNSGTIVGQAGSLTRPRIGREFFQESTGRLVADQCAVRFDQDLRGGTLEATNEGRFEVHTQQGNDLTARLGDGARLNAPLIIVDGARLDTIGTLENNSDITVHHESVSGSGAAILRLSPGSRVDGNGSIVLNAQWPSELAILDSGWLSTHATLGPGQRVRGAGEITGSLTLEGTITADRFGEELWLRGASVISSGRIGADGGTMVLRDATIEGGEVFVEGGGRVIDAGLLGFQGFGITLRDVRVSGLVEVRSIDLLSICVNEGVISATTYVDADTLLGDGQILLSASNARLDASVIGGTQTVRGQGTVNVGAADNACFIADVPDSRLVVRSGNGWIENSTIQADGGLLTLDQVDARDTTLTTQSDGRIEVLGSVNRLENVRIEPGARIQGVGGRMDLSGVATIQDGASFTSSPTLPLVVSFAPGSTLEANGEILLDAGTRPRDLALVAASKQTLIVPETARIEGTARLIGSFEVRGVLAPRGAIATIEHVMGTLRLGESATLDMRIGPDSVSQLRGQADFIEVGGALVVRHDSPQDIRPGDEWELITAQEISGSFNSITLPELPTTLRLDLSVTSRSVTLRAWCAADISQNGSVDFHDLSTFLTLFGQQADGADLTAPFGVWNFHDVAAFLALFNAACP